MTKTEHKTALADIAEREFLRLTQNAQAAINDLSNFWTRLYGPNEALTGAQNDLMEMDRTFFERED